MSSAPTEPIIVHGAVRRPLDPRRLTRAIAVLTIAGGVFTIVTILLPHQFTRYDRQYVAIGGALILLGAALFLWAQRRAERRVTVHASGAIL